MACVTAAEWDAFSTGQLSGEASAQVSRHLTGCADCRLRVGWTAPTAMREPAPASTSVGRRASAHTRDDAPRGRLGDTKVAAAEAAEEEEEDEPQEIFGRGDELARGTTVGRYLILERLGAGGMGMVYAAFDPQLDRKVAIKLLRANLGRNRVQFRARMLREAQAMARLAHPNVIAVHDVGTYDDRVFLAMELVEGGTIKTWLRKERPSVRAIVDVFLHAGRGLAAAHAAGLVHRDFKPENVLIGADRRARVTDFGLARTAITREDPSATPPENRIVTPSSQSSSPSSAHALALARSKHDDELDAAMADDNDPDNDETARHDKSAGEDSGTSSGKSVNGATTSSSNGSGEKNASESPVKKASSGELSLSRDPGLPSLDTSLTRAGTVMGTPGYMAPEQCRGEITDARGDQFAFCASLYEAVYKHRAFPGLTAEEIMDSVVDGKVREAPADSKVPTWIRRILLRGLAVDPEARFPSMDALLDQLGRDPLQRRRRWLAIGAALVAIGALLFGAQRWGAQKVRMCEGADRKLIGVWDPARKAALRTAFARSSKVYAAHVAEQSVAALDSYAAAWAAMNTDACEATRLRGVETEAMMGLRMSCLEQRRRELGALTDMLTTADDETVEKAVQAVSALPSVSMCADVQALSAVAPLPTDPSLRAQIAEEHSQLATARARLAAGKYQEGLGIAEDIPSQAAQLGYRPLAAEALELVGELRFKSGDYQGSGRAWKDAIYAAEESRLDEVKSEAAVKLANVTVDLSGFGEAHDWLRYAEASIKRFGGRGELQVNLWISIALVYFRESRYPEAETAARRAVSLAADVLPPRALGRAAAYRTLGDVLKYEGRYDEGLQLLEQAHGIVEEALGPEHPDTAAILRKEIDVYAMRGDGAHALELGRRVLLLLSKSLPPGHLQIAQTHTNIAEALGMLGRYEEAIVEERLALPTYERVFGPESEDVGVSCTNIGFALYKLGRDDEARRILLRAVGAYEKTLAANSPDIAEPMLHLGNIELRAHHPREALHWLEQAYKLRQKDRDPTEMLAGIEIGLARALWATGRPRGADRLRAVELASRARDQLASSTSKKDESAAVAAFLLQAQH